MNDTEKKKIFMMRVIIGSVAFIILILWAFNLKNVWQASRKDNKYSSEWSGLKSELEKTLTEAQAKLNKIEADKAAVEKKAGDKFMAGLLEGAVKNASSSAMTATSSTAIAASSTPPIAGGQTASTTKSGSLCPEYIDCMPTIGVAKPCVIPLGCEGITTIAY
ncbi:MAG: hypothetical protein WC719_02730 [Patescibacteria group bacterium]|jgi:hypothetical protein